MRWIFRIVAALALVLVAAVAALFLLPADRIAALVADQFRSATGREMTLQGDVRPTLWPELGVSIGAVSIANAPWSDAGPMLKAEALSVGVDWQSLFGGQLRIRKVTAVAPEILLELGPDGRGNWEFGAPAAAAAGPSAGQGAPGEGAALPEFAVDLARVEGGRLTFIDRSAGGAAVTLSDIDATLSLPGMQAPARVKLSARMNGQAFAAELEAGALKDLIAGAVTPLRASLKAGGTQIGFDGRAGISSLAAAGRLQADLADPAALFALIGQAAPELPQGLGQGAIRLTADTTVTGGGSVVSLRGATLALDDNVMKGDADLTLGGARPLIKAKLSAGALDFSALTGGGPEVPAQQGADAAAAEAASGWSREPIDVSGMRALDAELALSAESLDLGIAKLGRTRILTTLTDGRAVTEIREMAAYDGAITGSFVLNGRSGLSARATLSGKGTALQPLLMELAGYDRLITNGDWAVNILAVGDNLNALMHSLKGEGSVSLGKGAFRGLDLAAMLRNLDPSYVGEGAKTIFDAITASFTLDKGVLRNDDLTLTAPLLVANGKGTLDIGEMRQEYRITAALLGGQQNAGLKVPIIITGTWADPKIRLDMEALADTRLGKEVEAAKAKVETVIKDKIAEKTGVQVENLDNLDDAAKREIENRVKGALGGLLGGN